jgi:alpha-galactosidase
VHGVINEDKTSAIFSVSHLSAIKSSKAPNIQLAGLNPAAEYQVRMVEPAGAAETIQSSSPAWRFGAIISGDILNNHGLRAEKLQPENAYLIELRQIN